MGMGFGELELIKRLKMEGYLPAKGSVVEIGAQQLNDSFIEATGEIEKVKAVFGVNGAAPPFLRMCARDPDDALHGSPLSRDLWTWLGFDYASIDIDGTPGSLPLDLNFDDVPAGAIGKYCLVTNFGTTEHTVNQMQAFKIIHDLTAVEGVMLHNVPMGGMFSHGLISYNPKFFWKLARANGYKIVFMTLSTNAGLRPLTDDIVAELAKADSSLPARVCDYRSSECAIIAAFQKQFDEPFVPPLDVNEGATTEHPTLQSRYWTIFQSNPFAIREANVHQREEAIFDREQALARRERAVEGIESRYRFPDARAFLIRKLRGIFASQSR
jgi:hypothetical protein